MEDTREDKKKDEKDESLKGVAAVAGIGAIIAVGVALFGRQLVAALAPKPKPLAPPPGSEELSGVGTGMSSLIGPGPTPPGWRDGANMF